MNMYGLGENLNDLDREANIKRHIDYLGGVQKTLPTMKEDLLRHELRNHQGDVNVDERNLLYHGGKEEKPKNVSAYNMAKNIQISYVSPYRKETQDKNPETSRLIRKSRKEREEREVLLKSRFLQMDLLDLK